MKAVSATDANRNFSSLLQEVAKGASITLLSRGRPVAMMVPVEPNGDRRELARTALLDRLRAQAADAAVEWSRDELYD
jgi:prevent-host-death family protein